MNVAHRCLIVAFAVITLGLMNVATSPAAAPARNTLNEVTWLQQYVDKGYIQYEVNRHNPLSDGAVNCNVDGQNGVADYTYIHCQQFSFLSAAYGVVAAPENATDGRDYIHHALAMMTYPISYQNQSTGAYPAEPCGTHPSAWCTASDMTFAYTDFGHTLALLNQSTFYQQDDTEDHAIVSNTILPSLSKGLAWLSLSGTGQAYPDMLNDYTATNRIFIHAGAYYLTGEATAPYNSTIATTGMNDGIQFILEGTGPSHYIVANGSSYACVPASLCPWPAGSAFWTEDEDRSGSAIGYDSGYGGGALLMADFLAMHAQTSAAVTTMDTQLQGYSTWEYGRVFPSTGAITEEGNYRTCGQPLVPADQANCSYTNGTTIGYDTDVAMNWENVVWSLYYEAPFAPDNAGVSCAEYIAAARAIEYYYMPVSSYIALTNDTMYPDEQASGYNIPVSSAAAPAACSTTYTSLKAAVLTPGSRARAYFDRRSSTGGGVSLSSGDSITFPAIDAGMKYRVHSIALVYSLAAQRPQVVLVRINGGRPIEVVLPPTSTDARIRRLSTVDVPPINFFEGRRNSVAVQAEPAIGKIDLVSITPRIELSTLRAR